jgi:hypothetical protein
LGEDPRFSQLSPDEHFSLSKSTGCRGFAVAVIVTSGEWEVCDGAHRVIVMKKLLRFYVDAQKR